MRVCVCERDRESEVTCVCVVRVREREEIQVCIYIEGGRESRHMCVGIQVDRRKDAGEAPDRDSRGVREQVMESRRYNERDRESDVCVCCACVRERERRYKCIYRGIS